MHPSARFAAHVFSLSIVAAAALVACSSDSRGEGGSGGSSAGAGGSSAGSAGSSSAGAAGSAGSGTAGAGNICDLPQVAGDCFAAMSRFWFNSKTGQCEPFTYGGCGGNANNFETERACRMACEPACNLIDCMPNESCYYVRDGAVCAAPCGDNARCPAGQVCACGASCPGCEDCSDICVDVQK